MPSLPFTNGFYVDEALPLSNQECTNWFVKMRQTKNGAKEYLVGTPGIAQIATSGDLMQANRGALVQQNIPYFVNGTTLYELTRTISGADEVFAMNSLGTIEGTGRVSMATNGTQLMVLVPGGKGYIYNPDAGTPFQEITDADFTANGAPQYVIFVDGYFACTTNQKKWIVSALNDGLSWNALDFGSAESDPDGVVAPIKLNNDVYITGTQTTEGFQNSPGGGAGFPFERNGVFLDEGCFVPLSLIRLKQRFMMIGGGENESPSVLEYSGGGNYVRLSTNAIDEVLSSYTQEELDESFAWRYSDKGSSFVGFSFPDRTFVYEIFTNRWHERKSFDKGAFTRWRVASMVTAYDRVLVGDFVDGRIGEVSSAIYTEYDNPIVRVFSTQPFRTEEGKIKLPRLELITEPGLLDLERKRPSYAVEFSKDGKIFNSPKVRDTGAVGKYSHRVMWRQLGSYRPEVILKFTYSSSARPIVRDIKVA